jgi:hypothetical protein
MADLFGITYFCEQFFSKIKFVESGVFGDVPGRCYSSDTPKY